VGFGSESLSKMGWAKLAIQSVVDRPGWNPACSGGTAPIWAAQSAIRFLTIFLRALPKTKSRLTGR